MREVEVLVELKPEVLDVEGRAIREVIEAQGVKGLEELRSSKRYVLKVAGDLADDELLQKASTIAHDYLVSSVAESFTLRLGP